jgi:plasmid segregation protein ParM
MYIIAVDHGYGNIKTANTIISTGITSYDSEPMFTTNVLEYNGTWYRIGERQKEFISDKAIDDDYYLFTLVGIASELKNEGITDADVYLACGLPLAWVRTQRDTFRQYLTKKEKVNFRYNGEEYNVRIKGCSIFPQGYPAIVKDIDNYGGINMLADIGNGTMNIMYINNKQPQEERCWTEKYGVNQCMIRAKNAILDRFGIQMEAATIEDFFRTGTAEVGSQYLDVIRKVVEEYVEGIFAVLRRYEYNPDMMRLHFVGGGSCLVKNFGKYDTARVEIIDDICATAKGFEFLAQMALNRKDAEGKAKGKKED